MLALLLTAACCQFDLIDGPDAFDLVGAPAEMRPVKAQRVPAFHAYSIPGCANCPVAEKATNRLNSPLIEWKHHEAPAELKIQYYPAFHWETPDGGGKISQGWYGLDPLLKLYDESWGRKASQAAQAAPKVVLHSRGLYYNGQTEWSWPGDLRQHLSGTHGYDANWLAGLSDSQVMAIHNSDHNSGRIPARRGLFGGFRR